jgi:hypothetical protein
MLEWITENKVFSGIGGVVLTIVAGIIGHFIKKKKDENHSRQTITSGNNSNNIQGGNDVNVTIGDKNVRK